MRKVLSFFFPVFLLFLFLGFHLQNQQAQEKTSFIFGTGGGVRNLEAAFDEPYFKDQRSESKSAQIKNIQVFGEKSGIVFTSDALFRTDDNGETWREIGLPKDFSEKIGAVNFENETIGSAILGDNQNLRLELLQTDDGGNSWVKTPIKLTEKDSAEADLENTSLEILSNGEFLVSVRIPTSSNFSGNIFYESSNNRQNWNFKERTVELRRNDEALGIKADNKWVLKTDGNCEGLKIGCVQESKLFIESKEITPPNIKELTRIEKLNAKLQAENSIFAAPPNGTTRISLNRGFDKCTAATIAQMQTWWNNSPFYDVNIYLSGRNRGCSQAQLTANWVNSVTAQGWGLIPTVVGYQSPCTASTTSAKFSTDPAVAEQQGRGEADIAIADANNLGLTQGTVLYYDMERYDDLSGTGACSTPTKAFLKGWTDRLKERGYISGVYGSPFNAQGDWINMPQASQPDVVWLARWNNVMSVWGVAPLPDTFWTNHQRIHQWLGPRDETWGGVTFNIDNNISDAPVAGLAIAKNKRADFDGDGKSDISVWRPETGTWYVTNSSNSTYTILNFGISTDRLVPGDYDGDGKTDFAVWRPESGIWHLYSRSIYRSFAFGVSGDIAVPADYDGDGRTDVAVYRPSEGVWYIWNSFDSRGTSYTILQFGVSGDKPVPADYDGDGKTDIAIYRPSVGEWWIRRSSDASVYAFQFGNSADKPVQGDYSGDGKADVAFWRPSTGEWFILRSEDSSFYSIPFGASGDIPSAGDYDGDGKMDIGVFRPAEGVWYVSQSQAGVLITQFGVSTDSPIAAAYTP
jgi:hypothetical protein